MHTSLLFTLQSMAINMYLAKKAKLLGDTDEDFAKSSMMLAESVVCHLALIHMRSYLTIRICARYVMHLTHKLPFLACAWKDGSTKVVRCVMQRGFVCSASKCD